MSSSFVGLSPGGTHFSILVIKVDFNSSPSFKLSEYGILEIFALFKQENRKSLDLSPVKGLPVLVPPWAAGARPNINSFEFILPNPGTGFAQ